MDLQVIGAGPSGCFAAREAARLNLNVLLMEEHEEVGVPPHCSGLFSKEGVEKLGVDYKKTVLNKLYGAKIFSPDLNEVLVKAKEVKAFLVDRARFDNMCAESAVASGARLQLGSKASKSSIDAEILIGADGFNSGVAQWFNFPKINEFAFSYQADFENVELEDKQIVLVFLSSKFSPGFFSWVIPISDSEAKVGLGVWADAAKPTKFPSKHYFELLVRKHPVVSRILKDSRLVSQSSFCIPMRMRDKTVKGGVMLVGDAAGQAKATTGGGVIFGSQCAMVAGRTAAWNLRDGVSLGEYEMEWRKRFGADLLLHQRMRRLYNSMSDAMLNVCFAAAKGINIDEFLTKHGNMDRPTAMLDALKFLPGPFARAIKNRCEVQEWKFQST